MFTGVHRVTRSALVLAFLALAMVGTSCGKKESAEKETSEAKPAETVTAPALTDANIAEIALVANKMDIENANMAMKKTKNAAVKAFAQQMLTDHGSVIQQVNDLAKQLSLDPESGDTSRKLEADADATRKTIDEATGAAFDKAYIDNEVAFHESMIDLLDKTLVPGVTHPELKTFLTGLRPAFEAHLDHAKHVQATLPS
jgi:putative membrane protein